MEEIEILNWIHGICGCTFLDYVSIAVDIIFRYDIIWIILTLYLLKREDTKIVGISLLLAVILQMCVVYPTKFIVDRPRPFEEYAVDALMMNYASGSFPSGHAACSFCAAFIISTFSKEKGRYLYILALFIAFTRLYMYVHYPTDVLAGAAIGIACAYSAMAILHRNEWKTVYVEDNSDSD